MGHSDYKSNQRDLGSLASDLPPVERWQFEERDVVITDKRLHVRAKERGKSGSCFGSSSWRIGSSTIQHATLDRSSTPLKNRLDLRSDASETHSADRGVESIQVSAARAGGVQTTARVVVWTLLIFSIRRGIEFRD